MAFVGTVTSGLQLFASVIFSREHRAPTAGLIVARTHPSTRVTSIDQELAGRSGDSGLTMRWFADDALLRATWAGPKLVG